SRRRHTRSKRDWSSDVCSSDLITIPCLGKDLLLLRKDSVASNEDSILYRIVGGDFALDSNGGNARLEFRRLPYSNECMIALQEYEPTLPWWVYKYTQAKVQIGRAHV